MKHFARRLCALAVCLGLWSAGALGQSRGVDDAMLLKPLADNWPTYSGDYSGKRYSALTQINRANVKNLTLAWSTRIQPGMPAAGGRGGFGGFGGGPRGADDHRRRRHGRTERQRRPLRAHRRQRARGRRRALRHDSRQRVGDRRTRRTGPLEVRLEDARRDAHRQSRLRHEGQLSVHDDAGQLPGFARRAHRQPSDGT